MRLIFSRLRQRLFNATYDLGLMIRIVNFVIFLTAGCIVAAITTVALEVQLANLANHSDVVRAYKVRSLFYYDLLLESEREDRISGTYQFLEEIESEEDLPPYWLKFIELIGVDYILIELDHSLVWTRTFVDKLVKDGSLDQILTPKIRSNVKKLSDKFENSDYQDDDIVKKYMNLTYEIYSVFSDTYDKTQEKLLNKRKIASNIFLYSFLAQIVIYIFYYIAEHYFIGRRAYEE